MVTPRDLSPTLEPLGAAEAPSPVAPVAMRSMATNARPEAFFHLDLLRSLQLHRRLFLAIVGFGIALAAAYFLIAWPVYVAETVVYIQPAPPSLMGNPLVRTWPYDENTYESYIQQQINNVTRDDVLRNAIQKLPPGSWQRNGESEQRAVERLGGALKVERIGSSYQISISAKASQAAFAAQIANTVAAAFINTAKNDLRAGDPERIKLLGQERDRIQKALADDRSELEQVNRALGVAAVSTTTPDPYQLQINAVRADLEKARTDHEQASARLTSLAAPNAANSAALDAEADEIVAADPGLVSMKTALNQRRAQLISQMANLTPNHPQYKQNADELAKINSSLDTMMKDLRAKAAAHIQQRLRTDLERTGAFESRLNAQLGQLSNAAGNASSRLQRANDLTLDIQRLQNRFTAVDDQYRNLTLENNAPGAASISSAAVPPLHPSTDRMLRNLLILLLGTFFLAAAAALAAHHLDPRVYIATDIERVLGFSPMAQLPDFRQVSSAAGEEYFLRLAAAIEHAYQQGGLKSCVVTGVAPGAGTSTVASRVSTMLEGMGRSTVLVDASGTPPPPGAAGQVTTAQLATTRADGRPSALLQQMADEMDDNTIVLTDTAPLLASGETEYLARFVDSAIVVIQSGLTTRAQLREVAQTLQRLDVAAVGFVLNRVSIEKANPSFRQSVRAVEARLAIQNRGRTRHGRTRPTPDPDCDSAEDSPVVTGRDPVKHPRNGAAPHPAEAPPMQPPISSDPTREAAVTPEPEPSPAPRVARGRGEPQRSAPGAPRPAAAPSEPAAGAPSAAPAEPAPWVITPTAPPPPEPAIPPAPVSEPAPSAADRWTPPALSPQPFPDDLASERDDAGYAAASRLGGLRNLLVTLGRRSLNAEEDFAGGAEDIEPRFERATVRPAYSDTPVPAAEAPENGTLSRLSARPEILPPKPTVDTEKEKETVRTSPTAPRRDNYDPDEIQTLPSWRGQYRKKRYPPL